MAGSNVLTSSSEKKLQTRVLPLSAWAIFQKIVFFLHFFYLCKPRTQRIIDQICKTIPPFDSKFYVDYENWVNFEIYGANFQDIQLNVTHGKRAYI